jgi:hypothetical protein
MLRKVKQQLMKICTRVFGNVLSRWCTTWNCSGVSNTRAHSVIYQLKCHSCNLSYVGQTEHGVELRFKEHIRYITSNNPQWVYAIHIVHSAHKYGPMDTTIMLLYTAQKS